MKNNLRNKFRDFLASEEGRVGAKAPLTVGIAGGSLLFAQAIQAPAHPGHWENIECWDSNDCPEGEKCEAFCDEWSAGWCIGHWNTECR